MLHWGEKNQETSAWRTAAVINPESAAYDSLIRVAEVMSGIDDERVKELIVQAEDTIRRIEQPLKRVEALVDLAGRLAVSSPSRSAELLEEGYGLQQPIKDAERRTHALLLLAGTRAEIDPQRAAVDLQEARAAAVAIPEVGGDSPSQAFGQGRSANLRATWKLMVQLEHPEAEATLADAVRAFEGELALNPGIGYEDSWYEQLAGDALAVGRLGIALDAVARISKDHTRFHTVRKLLPGIIKQDPKEGEARLQYLLDQIDLAANGFAKGEFGYWAVETLVELGRLEEATRVANDIREEHGRSGAFHKIVEYFGQTGQFKQARDLVLNIPEDRLRADAEGELGTRLANGGEIADAREMAANTQDYRARARILGAVARWLARQGDPAAPEAYNEACLARESVQQLYGDYKGAVHGLARVLIEAKDLDRAYLISRGIRDHWSRTSALTEIGEAFALLDDPRAVEALKEAEVANRMMEDAYYRDTELSKIGSAYARIGHWEEAFELTKRLQMWSSAKAVLTAAVVQMSRVSDPRIDWVFETGRQAAEYNKDETWAPDTLTEIVKNAEASEKQRFSWYVKLAGDAIRAIGKPIDQAKASCKLARGVADRAPALAKDLLEEAERIAHAQPDDLSANSVLSDVALGLFEFGERLRARELASAIGDWTPRASALSGCVDILVDTGEIVNAEQIVRGETNRFALKQLLLRYGLALARNGHEQADAVFEEVDRIVRYEAWASHEGDDFASTLLRAGRVISGLRALHPLSMDYLIYLVCEWLRDLASRRAGLANECVVEMVAVAAWYRTEWRLIQNLLMRN